MADITVPIQGLLGSNKRFKIQKPKPAAVDVPPFTLFEHLRVISNASNFTEAAKPSYIRLKI